VAVVGVGTVDAVVMAGRGRTSPGVIPEPRGNAEGEIPKRNARVVLLAENVTIVRRNGLTVRVGWHDLTQPRDGVPPGHEELFWFTAAGVGNLEDG